ncbi:MAG: multidrug effflux MFS transporter [Pseudomonadota bacterium]
MPSAQDRAQGRLPGPLLAFLALMTSLVAMSIDAVLPALDAIDADVRFASPNDRQLVVTAVLAGLAVAQLVVGPLADAFGRRAVALGGLVLFALGTLIAGTASDPTTLLAGRALQGLGAAGPRVMAVTILRDLYAGRPMARASSLVNTIFMLVPLLAPLLGLGIEMVGGWRGIFAVYGLMAGAIAVWYLAAMPETLAPADRRPLRLGPLTEAYGTVFANGQARVAIGVVALVFAGFTAYLASAQQIFEELYDLGANFVLVFGLLAIPFAAASFINGRLVMRLGMRRLIGFGTWTLTLGAAVGVAAAVAWNGVPPLWATVAVLAVVFVAVSIVFANAVALATEPLGRIAGTATSVALSFGTLGAAALGTVIARLYDDTVTPLFAGFALSGLAAAALHARLGPAQGAGQSAAQSAGQGVGERVDPDAGERAGRVSGQGVGQGEDQHAGQHAGQSAGQSAGQRTGQRTGQGAEPRP